MDQMEFFVQLITRVLENPWNLLFSLLLCFFPLVLVAIPYFFFRGNESFGKKIYGRFLIGFLGFWMIYFLLPSIIALINPPPESYGLTPVYYNQSSNEYQSDVWAPTDSGFILYLIQTFVNSVILFLYYPIIVLPFIFVIGPVLSFGIIYFRLRNEDKEKSFSEKLNEIDYDTETSFIEQIRERVFSNDWKSEKEFFKIILAVLPISLYLLMTLLKVLGYEEKQSILQGTSLGWFLEIFFVYLVTIVFAVHLVASSKLSYKGNYFGQRIRDSFFQSLSTVGAFISSFAILLFIIDYFDKIFIVIYFVGYVLMTSIIFILILDICEPVSIYILTKLIEFAKGAKSSVYIGDLIKIFFVSFCIHIIFVAADFTLRIFLIIFLGGDVFEGTSFGLFYNDSHIYITLILLAASTLFLRKINWHSIANGIVIYLAGIVVLGIWFVLYRIYPLLALGYPVAGEEVIPGPTFTQIAGVQTKWLTAVFRIGTYQGINFATLEIREIEVNFVDLLGWLAIPFQYLHVLSIIMLFSLLFFYSGCLFLTNILEGDDQTVEKSIFSERSTIPTKHEVVVIPENFLIFKNYYYSEDGAYIRTHDSKRFDGLRIEDELSGIANSSVVLSGLNEEYGVSFAELSEATELPIENLLNVMRTINESKAEQAKPFILYQKEYGFTYEEVSLDSLHVMKTDGRSVFQHDFTEVSRVEPALVAGLFAAITSFAKEAVQSEQLLRTIDHGDVVLIIEYGKWVFGAIFADRNSAVLRKNLRSFLDDFETRHEKELPDWLGDLAPFESEHEEAEAVFL